MPNPDNEPQLPKNQSPIIDDRTGLVSRDWYRFFLNLLNKANYGKYDTWGGGPSTPAQNKWGGDNANAGKPGGLTGPMRTVKVGMKVDF